jgi:hypothetical protein
VLEPSEKAIKEIFASKKKILQKTAKYELFKKLHSAQKDLASVLSTVCQTSMAKFNGLEWGSKCKAENGYSTEFLGGVLFDTYSSLQILIPPSRHHFAVTSTPLKETVAQLRTYYGMMKHQVPNLSTSMGQKRITTNLMEETNFAFAALTNTLITQIQTSEAYLREILPERWQMMLRQRMMLQQ